MRRCEPIFHLLAECDQHHFTVIRLIGRTVWLSSPAVLLLSAFHSNKIKQNTSLDATAGMFNLLTHKKKPLLCTLFTFLRQACARMSIAIILHAFLPSVVDKKGKVYLLQVTPTHRPLLLPGISWYSFLETESTPGRWTCRMLRKKSPVTRPGIDPGTFRLVAQRLNRYSTPGPCR